MSPSGSSNAPEAKARTRIDQALAESGWTLQDRDDMNLAASPAIAVREFKLDKAHGYVDYMLFLDGHPVGVCEAKPAGAALIGVEHQVKKYVQGIPAALAAPYKPLPFAYLSTGEETLFINHFDPHPRTRPVFSFHRPDTLREWLTADTLDAWLKRPGGFYTAADETKPSTLRARLRAMPPVELPGMWPNKVQAVASVEKSLFDDRPRSLIQMATGSGKTLLAVTTLYRLIKFGGARRVLFLVDRANLGEQAEKEFQGFRTPDDKRLFTELYGVQRLTSNTIGSSSKVVISTIQRLYSILKGEPELDPEVEEHSNLDSGPEPREPMPVVYNAAVPPEFFDVIFIDECHRSIYSLWRQVLEYFDAHLIGLTATPAKHTYGFFNQNVVMEYPHAQAVADGVNCDYEVYRIRTQITAAGSTIEATPGTMVGYRDRQTRKTRWEAPDEDVTYAASDLDRNVVAIDQIRLIVQTFRDKVLKETFPERTEVPKTLIFAKDDSHAEDTIAQGLSAYRPDAAALTAGKVMRERLRALASMRRDFAFETTLSGRSHARWLRELQASGYRTHLIFLSLPSADLAVARVADRVRRGGHHVPNAVVRRRFVAGLRNLFSVYMPAVDAWNVYDNADVVSPRLIASRAFGAAAVVADAEAWKSLKELPS